MLPNDLACTHKLALPLCVCMCGVRSFENALVTSATTADFYTQRKPMSATINTLANALYKVFSYTGKARGCVFVCVVCTCDECNHQHPG